MPPIRPKVSQAINGDWEVQKRNRNHKDHFRRIRPALVIVREADEIKDEPGGEAIRDKFRVRPRCLSQEFDPSYAS